MAGVIVTSMRKKMLSSVVNEGSELGMAGSLSDGKQQKAEILVPGKWRCCRMIGNSA